MTHSVQVLREFIDSKFNRIYFSNLSMLLSAFANSMKVHPKARGMLRLWRNYLENRRVAFVKENSTLQYAIFGKIEKFL